MLLFCADSQVMLKVLCKRPVLTDQHVADSPEMPQEELCVATWGLTGTVVFLTALAALSEVVEGRLPADPNALLPNAVYTAWQSLQSLWHWYGDQVSWRPAYVC